MKTKTNKVTKKQREVMNRNGRYSPLSFETRDAAIERIAQWAIDTDHEILEVEAHDAFFLVAFADGSVHRFGGHSGAYISCLFG